MTSPAPPRRLRRVVLRASLALVSALAGLEVVVRVFVGSPMAERLPILRIRANELRGFEMIPSETHYTYHHRVQMNALGLRGPEVEPKAENEVRIFALGDSLLYGQGVADDETIPARLEALLDARDEEREWTVVNGGHRAYATHQEVGLLTELGRAVDPDVVMVFWFWNDLYERDIAGTYGRLSAAGPLAFDVGAEVEGWVEFKWRVVQLVRRSAAVMYLHDLYNATQAGPPRAEAYEKGMERFAKYATRFEREAGRLGARLVYVIVPDYRGLHGEHHHSGPIEARAYEILVERGIPVLTFRTEVAALAREKGRLPVLPFDGHYDADANGVMAEGIARSELFERWPAEWGDPTE